MIKYFILCRRVTSIIYSDLRNSISVNVFGVKSIVTIAFVSQVTAVGHAAILAFIQRYVPSMVCSL
jgi:hypothetical protein